MDYIVGKKIVVEAIPKFHVEIIRRTHVTRHQRYDVQYSRSKWPERDWKILFGHF